MIKCESTEWCNKATRCPQAEEGFEPYHKWIVTSKVKTQSSESATMIMCGICFHEINLSEAHKHRDLLSS